MFLEVNISTPQNFKYFLTWISPISLRKAIWLRDDGS